MAVLFGGVALILGQLWGLSFGALAAFVGVMQSTYGPLRDLTRGWTKLQEAVPSAERFFEILDEGSETPDPPDAVRHVGVRHGIRFSKVTFSYGREPVLRDVSLDVKAGEMVAIVGRTGSGKTTLVDLLLRFYDPDAGAIEVDGVDLRRIARESWLEHVAVVTQEPFLFAGTIRDNIALRTRPGPRRRSCARPPASHTWTSSSTVCPQGWDTDVGDAGTLLSGGQRQRITIARAVLKNPEILIFDEATSALDAKSERLVQEAIDGLLTGPHHLRDRAPALDRAPRRQDPRARARHASPRSAPTTSCSPAGSRYAELMSHQSEGVF